MKLKHIGNLIIGTDNAGEYAALTEVPGYLSIYGKANLPLITSVVGHLHKSLLIGESDE